MPPPPLTIFESTPLPSVSGLSSPSSSSNGVSWKNIPSISSITSNIFIGSDNFTEEDLKKNNITHIINISCKKDIKYNNITSLFINLPDGGNPHNGKAIDDYFPLAIDFIQNAIDNNGKVLVHCHMGISRSATLVMAYIMNINKLPYEKVLLMVRNKRPIIDPCFVFIWKLLEYQRKLGIPSPVSSPCI